MKRKTSIAFQSLLCLILISGDTSTAKPLNPEDLQSLLPPTPRDKNETLAAVVQDPVVQDAVHSAASNGSLNRLVVKKKVYIMPASDPYTILSKTEHLLVVPTENLEDVRKNITETKRAEAEATETSSPENLPLFEDDGYTAENDAKFDFQETENTAQRSTNEISSLTEESTSTATLTSEKRKTESKLLKDAIGHDAPLPEDAPNKIPVPIVAVIDPSNVEKHKVDTPIIAILPSKLNNGVLKTQIDFLKENSDKIQKEAQSYIEQTSMAINTGYQTPSTEITMDSSTLQGTAAASFLPEPEVSSFGTEQVFLTPVVVPRWEIVAPIFPNNGGDYPREPGDMDVAEDIIFRPLFRYRQESQERSRYRENGGNRRYAYKPYRDYDYPRRGYYRSRYDDY